MISIYIQQRGPASELIHMVAGGTMFLRCYETEDPTSFTAIVCSLPWSPCHTGLPTGQDITGAVLIGRWLAGKEQ